MLAKQNDWTDMSEHGQTLVLLCACMLTLFFGYIRRLIYTIFKIMWFNEHRYGFQNDR